MAHSEFTDAQKRAIIEEKERDNLTVEEVTKRHRISPATYYLWAKSIRVQDNSGLSGRIHRRPSFGGTGLTARNEQLEETVVEQALKIRELERQLADARKGRK